MIASTRRNLRLDGLKLFLVTMVVVGHCVQPFRYDNAMLGGLYGIIYSFHMPLFVILSGYFFKIEEWRHETEKSLRLLETFVLVTLAFWFAGRMSYTWPLVRLGGCPSWYLLSLVFWRVVSNLLLRKIHIKQLFFYSIILSIGIFILLNKGEGIFSAMRIVQYYPYFLLGYAIKQGSFEMENVSAKTMLFLSCLSAVVIFAFSSYALYTQEFQDIGLLRWCKQFNMSLLAGVGVFLFVKIVALINSYSVWFLLHLPNCIAEYGKSSLLIYAVHTMTLPLIYHYCTALWQTSIVAIITIVLLMWLSRTPLEKWLTNPISTIFKKI